MVKALLLVRRVHDARLKWNVESEKNCVDMALLIRVEHRM